MDLDAYNVSGRQSCHSGPGVARSVLQGGGLVLSGACKCWPRGRDDGRFGPGRENRLYCTHCRASSVEKPRWDCLLAALLCQWQHVIPGLEGAITYYIVCTVYIEHLPGKAIPMGQPQVTRDRHVHMQFDLKAIYCSWIWAVTATHCIWVSLGCHLVEQIFQQIQFNIIK